MLDGKSNQVEIWLVFGTRLTPAMLASYDFWFAGTYPGTSLRTVMLNIGGLTQWKGRGCSDRNETECRVIVSSITIPYLHNFLGMFFNKVLKMM